YITKLILISFRRSAAEPRNDAPRQLSSQNAMAGQRASHSSSAAKGETVLSEKAFRSTFFSRSSTPRHMLSGALPCNLHPATCYPETCTLHPSFLAIGLPSLYSHPHQ